MDAEDVKVKPEGASNVINIVVKDQNSGEVHFKVRWVTHLIVRVTVDESLLYI